MGEDSYDGLGDALQEGRDELNDETFDGTGKVGESSVFCLIGTEQARTSISHSRHRYLITIPDLLCLNWPPAQRDPRDMAAMSPCGCGVS